jgi:ribosome biogenesis protein BMS1
MPFLVQLLTCHFTGKGKDFGADLVRSLQGTKYSLNEKLEKSFINLFGRRPSAQLEDNVVDGNAISSIQDDQGDAKQVDSVNIANADTMDSSGHSECSSDSEGDGDKLSDPDVELREKVEFHNGRLRRKAVSSNFQDDIDDEV